MTMVVRSAFSTIERAAHRLLVHRIEMRGRLVQDQHRRVLEEGAGDGDALALAAGEAGAALADLGIQPVGQGLDQLGQRGMGDGGTPAPPRSPRAGRSGCCGGACR